MVCEDVIRSIRARLMRICCRSWLKYEEEKHRSPRVFNFQSISEHDALTRTLNEIHKCVLPKEDEYRLFKSPEEIAMSSSQAGSSAVVEVKDPRRNPTRLMTPSVELVANYGFSSELNKNEQSELIDGLKLKIIHNPKLVKRAPPRREPREVKLELVAKHKTEATHFNKCAEIFFYRHVSEFNNLVDADLQSFLVSRWEELESHRDGRKFQAITMLLRDQTIDGSVQVELRDAPSGVKHSIRVDEFPPLSRCSIDDLKIYYDLKNSRRVESVPNTDTDVLLSLELLSKLFVDTEEFSVGFTNRLSPSGSLFTTFCDSLPPKPASIPHALEEFIRIALNMNIELSNINSWVKTSDDDSTNFQPQNVDEFMKKLFLRHQKEAGGSEMRQEWKINNGARSFTIAVQQADAHSIKLDDVIMPADISIKLEFQTKFGAEKMTRCELLKEWCAMKFNAGSITLRYRVSAMTLEILSITRVNIEDVECELKDFHATNPCSLLPNLVNAFLCIRQLPPDDYLAQTTVEEGCKKLFILRASEHGKDIADQRWEVASTFTRKWIPIDDATPTFLHVNHHFPPCCFPITNRKLSYLPKPQKNEKKKVSNDPATPLTMEQKAMQGKKAAKRKRKMVKTLN